MSQNSGKLHHHWCELGVANCMQGSVSAYNKNGEIVLWIIKQLALVLIDQLCSSLKMVLGFVAEEIILQFFQVYTSYSKSFLCKAV